jgi:transposase
LEESSGNRRRLGHITKQGSSILRFLLVEAAQVTVRVAMARKLAVRLYWMWRQGWNYEPWIKFGSQGRKLSSHAVATKGSIR